MYLGPSHRCADSASSRTLWANARTRLAFSGSTGLLLMTVKVPAQSISSQMPHRRTATAVWSGVSSELTDRECFERDCVSSVELGDALGTFEGDDSM